MADEDEAVQRRRRRSSHRSSRDNANNTDGHGGSGVGGGHTGSACSVRSCGAPAAGTGSRSVQPLCARHMAEDAARLAEQRAGAQRRLRALLGDTAAANAEAAAAERQALLAELTVTEAAFDAARSCLIRWHEALIGRLAKRLEVATRDDSDAAAAQQYEREISEAERAGGGGQRVFELLTQLELLLTGMEERRGSGARRFFPPPAPGSNYDEACDNKPRVASWPARPLPAFVGDVSGRVRELQFVISRHLVASEALCDPECDTEKKRKQSLDRQSVECDSSVGGGIGECGSIGECGGIGECGNSVRRRRNRPRSRQQCDASPNRGCLNPVPPPPCRLAGCVSDLSGQPLLLAVCTNTAGYTGDNSGRVTRWDEAPMATSNAGGPDAHMMMAGGSTSAASESGIGGGVGLGQSQQQQQQQRLPEPCVFVAFEPEERRDHLLLVPLECLGQGPAPRLRCHCALDWRREVRGLHCDSAAQLLYIAQDAAVSVADLSGRLVRVIGGGLGCLTGLDGDSDAAYAFDRQARRLLVVDKAAGGLRAAFLADSFHGGGHDKLAVLGNKVLLTDWCSGRLHKLCATSGRLVTSYPNALTCRDAFYGPACVATDSSGSGLVFVSECERRQVQILSGDGVILQSLGADYCFCIPWGLAVVELGGGRRQLIVADNGNQRLLVFELL